MIYIADRHDSPTFAADGDAILEEVELTTLYRQHSACTSLARLLWLDVDETAPLPGQRVCRALRASPGTGIVQEAVPGYRGHLGVVPNGVDLHHYAADYGPYQPESIGTPAP